MLLSSWFERGHQPPSPSTSSTSVTPRCCTDLPPAGWGVCLDAAPSVWRSRARRSGRTTSPSSCSAGLCTGHSAGWTGCGSSAAAGSWPPRTAGPGWAGPGSAGLLSALEKKWDVFHRWQETGTVFTCSLGSVNGRDGQNVVVKSLFSL